MQRKTYDELIRKIADSTQSNFYWVEMQLTFMMRDIITDEVKEFKDEIKNLKEEVEFLRKQIPGNEQ